MTFSDFIWRHWSLKDMTEFEHYLIVNDLVAGQQEEAFVKFMLM